ncbi:MAG: PKD domain-containing protein [Bacteroidia bacterium]
MIHTIRLRVSNACGFRDTTVSITVHPAVVAQFTATPNPICEGGTVTFNQNSLGSNLTYSWNFGNGNTSTLPGPHTQTYPTAGTYNATLTVTGFCGTNTMTVPIVVRPYPVLNYAPIPDSGCAPLVVNINNTSTPGGTNSWNFGAGAVPATSAVYSPPAITYNTPGIKTITYTVNLNGCSRTRLDTVIVRPKPTVTFTASPTSGCSPLTVTINNTTATVGGETWSWTFGDGGTSNAQQPGSHTYTNPGPGTLIRNLKLVVTNGFGCRDSLTVPITIFPIPVAQFTASPDSGCLPLTVTIANSSTTGGTYSWNFGAGAAPATSTAYNPPAIVYSTPGIKVITLTVTRNGCSATRTDTVIVRPKPVVTFTASPTSGCSPLTVTINNTTTTVGGETWSWTFGDGGTSNLQQPGTYTYTNPGPGTLIRNLKLVVTNGFGCKDSLTVPITVFPIPIAQFNAAPDSGCLPLTVTMTNTSTTGGTYAWNFGAGAAPATSTAYNPPAVVYSTPGIKVITLTVTRNGCSATTTDTVIVRPRPVVAFTTTPTSGCSPLTVSFNNTTATVGGETWSWTFGDGGTSNLQNPPPHVYTNPGPGTLIRTVKLVVDNGFGCADSVTHTVAIYPLPTAGFNSPSQACVTFPVPFTNTSTGANTFSWTFGDGGTSTQTNPSHTYTATGTYTVTLISSTAFGCRDTVTNTIQLDTIPDAQWVADTVCIGNPTSFTDLSAGSPISWAWTFGDGGTSTLQNPQHSYAAPGTYSVKLKVFNGFGCPDSLIRQVVVNPVPVANFSAPPVCFGMPSIFTSTSTGSPVLFDWDFGDGNTGSTANPTHVYTAAGTYNVTLIVFSGVGCSDTITRQVIVNPVPTTDFAADTVCYLLSTTFSDQSLGSPTFWNWTFGDGGTSTIQNPSHAYAAAGSYTVTLVSGYTATGCRDTMAHTVIVHPRPVAAFTTGPVLLNDTTQFQDQSTNTPNQWVWDFGDGYNDTQQNPTHVYGSPTTYTVGLWVQNAFGCADSTTQNVTVYPRPVAEFQTDSVCQNLWTTFTDLSNSAVTWHYDLGDGDTSNLASPTHLYTNAGTFTVTQIVWNVFGCTDTILHPVIVDSLPVAEFASDTSCFGFANQFNDLSAANAAGMNWNWDFGDTLGVSTQQNPAYIYGDSGTYTVTLIVQNSWGCGDTVSHTAVVYPIPIAGWVNPTACARNVVQFTDTSTSSPTQWWWDFGDGSPVDTTQNPSHVYAVGGSYTVTLIAGNPEGCMDTAVLAIPVYTVPVPAFTNDTVCQGNATQFVNGSTDPNPMSYLWSFGDGNSSPLQDPQYIYPDSGWYTVRLVTSNVYGCHDSIFHDVYVAPMPAVDILADTVCLGQPTSLNGQTSPFVTQWAWDFGDGNTSNLQNAIHTFGTPGNQTVSLSVNTAFGCTGSITRNIFVEIAPVANFDFSQLHCAGTDIQFNNLTFGNGALMNWTFGDGGTSNQASPAYTYSAPGNYSVTLIASSSNGCADTVSSPLVVHDLPQAAFLADTVCLGGPTQFTDASAGDSLDAWFWDFGNNSNTAYGQTPGYVYYPSADTFAVSLIVTNIWGCTDTTQGNILVTPLAVAAFSSNPTLPAQLELYEGTVQFTNQSQFADGWVWDFGDGDTSSVLSPSHTYTNFGEYCVTLAVWSIGGCVDTVRACNLVILAGVPDIPNTFSPNGDGVNDVFEIRNIDAFPDNTLEVFNRWGNKVYEKDKYHNEWDGRNWKNDQVLPDGAYFFVFKPGPEMDEIVGDVVIFR